MRRGTLIALSVGVIFNLIDVATIANADTGPSQNGPADATTSATPPVTAPNKCGRGKCATMNNGMTIPQAKCGVNKCKMKTPESTAPSTPTPASVPVQPADGT